MERFAIKALKAIVALTIAFGAGFYVKGQFVLADQAKQAKAGVKDTARSIVESAEKSVSIETDITQFNQQVAILKGAAVKRMEKVHEKRKPSALNPQDAKTDPVADRDVLDYGTVRLLNATRTGRGLEPGGLDAGKEPTAAETPR